MSAVGWGVQALGDVSVHVEGSVQRDCDRAGSGSFVVPSCVREVVQTLLGHHQFSRAECFLHACGPLNINLSFRDACVCSDLLISTLVPLLSTSAAFIPTLKTNECLHLAGDRWIQLLFD